MKSRLTIIGVLFGVLFTLSSCKERDVYVISIENLSSQTKTEISDKKQIKEFLDSWSQKKKVMLKRAPKFTHRITTSVKKETFSVLYGENILQDESEKGNVYYRIDKQDILQRLISPN